MVHWGGELASAAEAEAAVISDAPADNFSRETNALWVGNTGNIAVVFAGGGAVTFVGVQAGTILPVRAIRVNATNTTVTDVVGLFTRMR